MASWTNHRRMRRGTYSEYDISRDFLRLNGLMPMTDDLNIDNGTTSNRVQWDPDGVLDAMSEILCANDALRLSLLRTSGSEGWFFDIKADSPGFRVRRRGAGASKWPLATIGDLTDGTAGGDTYHIHE